MINDQEYKVQEEKFDWEEKVKHEFPEIWLERLAMIKTAESILGIETLNQGINWKKVYRACKIYYNKDVFSSLYNNTEMARINQCYQQLIQGDEKVLEKIYYFSNIRLNIFSKQIGDEDAASIAEALKSEHCKLISLHLYKNQVGDKGVASIADALKSKHCKLTSLDLNDNSITEKGAKALAEALKSEHCKLTSLNLWRNQIGDAETASITDVLKSEHCKLISLNLGNNQIGDAGAKEIADALKSGHCKLASLDIRHNKISKAGALAIALAFKHPHCPRDLHIEWDSAVKQYILESNKEWEQAQILYTLLSHSDGNSQHLSVLPPYVTTKCLFPYLFDIFKDEPQSQVGDYFLENHAEHFKMMQAQRQDALGLYETKSSRQALDEKKLPQPSSSVNSSCVIS